MSNEPSSSPYRFGSWAWLQATGGIMTPRERREAMPGLGRTFARFALDRARLAFGTKPRHSYGAHDLWPAAPDSSFAADAAAEAKDLQSDAMLNHGYRTWLFGMSLASIDGCALDSELFFTGALLHDVGLEHLHPGRCFTHRSAEAAQAVAQRAEVGEQRTLDVMDGIAMHISPNLDRGDSLLGYYLQAGAMADLAGLRAWELPAELRARAAAEYPRVDVHRVVSGCWHAESKLVPGGRAHFAEKYGAFSKIVRFLPVR